MGRLDGRVAVITGAGGELMRAAAILFAKEGAKIVVADLVPESGDNTVSMIREAGGEAVFINTNVSKADDVRSMVKEAVARYGRIDALVSGAGIAPSEVSTVDCAEDVFDKILTVNLKGVWLGMKYVIPEMLKTGGGSIVNIASIGAHRGVPGIAIYSAAKGGIISMSRVAHVEYGSRNIRINCISPGPIATELLKRHHSAEEIKQLTRVTTRGRLGSPEEVASVALFLASSESSHVMGQTIIMDGGMEADGHVAS